MATECCSCGSRNRKLETHHSTLKGTINEGYRLANVVLFDHPLLYQFAGVQHRAVIASPECIANFVQGRLGKLAREIHRHLPREGDAGRAPLACHVRDAHIEMFGHAALNLFDRDGMASFLLQNIF